MAERRLIFNAKGFQLGYIEGDAAFDLSGSIGWNIRWSLVAIRRPVWKT
jgi:hypothetical protein